MAKISVNLDGVGDAREVIEAGRYEARVTEVEASESQSGNPMLIWKWEITKGDHAGVELKSYTSLQEHALFGLKNHLGAFGIEPDGEMDFDTDDFAGKRAILVVTKEQIQSRQSDGMVDVNRIKSVYPLDKSSGGSPSKGQTQIKKPAIKGAAGKKVPF